MIETGPGIDIDFAVVSLGALLAGMLLETIRPLRSVESPALRWLNNGSLALITWSCGHFAGTLLAFYVLSGLGPRDFPGLGSLPLWLSLPLAFLALEFTRYAIHVAMHKVPLLWQLHALHHSDPEVDISTSFRHHPLESLLSAVPVTAVVWAMGATPLVLVLYRTCDIVMAVLAHTNIALPAWLDRWLRLVLVTPSFHRSHHFAEQRHTDSNYSSILPWFDYLFRTYRSTSAEQQQMAPLGLDTHTPHEQRLDGMLLAPFRRRRLSETVPAGGATGQ